MWGQPVRVLYEKYIQTVPAGFIIVALLGKLVSGINIQHCTGIVRYHTSMTVPVSTTYFIPSTAYRYAISVTKFFKKYLVQ
eukprot:SAG11_NODE_14967_length_593_cov_0.807692_1_plen_80_part_10